MLKHHWCKKLAAMNFKKGHAAGQNKAEIRVVKEGIMLVIIFNNHNSSHKTLKQQCAKLISLCS